MLLAAIVAVPGCGRAFNPDSTTFTWVDNRPSKPAEPQTPVAARLPDLIAAGAAGAVGAIEPAAGAVLGAAFIGLQATQNLATVEGQGVHAGTGGPAEVEAEWYGGIEGEEGQIKSLYITPQAKQKE